MAMLWTNDMVMGYIIQKFSLHTILWILHYSVFKEYDMLPNPQERNIRSLAQLFKKYLAKKGFQRFQIHIIIFVYFIYVFFMILQSNFFKSKSNNSSVITCLIKIFFGWLRLLEIPWKRQYECASIFRQVGDIIILCFSYGHLFSLVVPIWICLYGKKLSMYRS